MANSSSSGSGRLDVLVQGLVERLVTSSGNPVAQAMYPAYKEGIDGLIEEYLAPRTKTGRIIRVKQPKDETVTESRSVGKRRQPKSKTVSNKVNGSGSGNRSGNGYGSDNYTVIDV